MNPKIDTREKFTIITLDSDFSSDNLTAEFKELIHLQLQHKTNIVINLKNIARLDEAAIEELAALQEQFYAQNISFVLCGIVPAVLAVIKEMELDDVMNITPTETEALDIVQMEEVERELLGDE